MTEIRHSDGDQGRSSPWVELRTASYRTLVFRKMVRSASTDARPGDCVTVYDREGRVFGHGLYNVESNIALRMLNFDSTPVGAEFWRAAIRRAAQLRTVKLNLPKVTDAYRLVHAEGDGLSGLVVDRYGEVLSVGVYSLGIWRQRDTWLPMLLEEAGCQGYRIRADKTVQQREGFAAPPVESTDLPESVNIREHGVRFSVRFDMGHKTGFFCDQRDNRLRLAHMTSGADVLDLCSFSGGFGIFAKTIGGAHLVRCVDLDEDAIALARRNANLNQVRVDTVHSDAFIYMRQMQANGRTFEVVVLDPPKLMAGRKDREAGLHKYRDLNRLACGLVSPGGLLVTCSCSGAFLREEFAEMVVAATRHAGRRCQILDMTGPGMDHPVDPRCPESAYLKVAWLRLD